MTAELSSRAARLWTWLFGALALAAFCGLLGLVLWMSLPPAPSTALGLDPARADRQAGLAAARRARSSPRLAVSAPAEALLGSVAWHEPEGATAGSREPLTAFVQRMAMQALVVPVLDAETQPPRWSDPDLTMPCLGHGQVSVNGRRLEAGLEQPAGAFTLHWLMEGCLPFGPEGPVFTGSVEVDVFLDDEGPSASLRPHGLLVTRGDQHAVLNQPFGARMP